MDFAKAWTPKLRMRCPDLMHFMGSIAVVFPNNASVEQDFSVVKFEKTPKRARLADMALQGCLYARHFFGDKKGKAGVPH